jgi:hypothetical protein
MAYLLRLLFPAIVLKLGVCFMLLFGAFALYGWVSEGIWTWATWLPLLGAWLLGNVLFFLSMAGFFSILFERRKAGLGRRVWDFL